MENKFFPCTKKFLLDKYRVNIILLISNPFSKLYIKPDKTFKFHFTLTTFDGICFPSVKLLKIRIRFVMWFLNYWQKVIFFMHEIFIFKMLMMTFVLHYLFSLLSFFFFSALFIPDGPNEDLVSIHLCVKELVLSGKKFYWLAKQMSFYAGFTA